MGPQVRGRPVQEQDALPRFRRRKVVAHCDDRGRVGSEGQLGRGPCPRVQVGRGLVQEEQGRRCQPSPGQSNAAAFGRGEVVRAERAGGVSGEGARVKVSMASVMRGAGASGAR